VIAEVREVRRVRDDERVQKSKVKGQRSSVRLKV
jgi:hypothetical protein